MVESKLFQFANWNSSDGEMTKDFELYHEGKFYKYSLVNKNCFGTKILGYPFKIGAGNILQTLLNNKY